MTAHTDRCLAEAKTLEEEEAICAAEEAARDRILQELTKLNAEASEISARLGQAQGHD